MNEWTNGLLMSWDKPIAYVAYTINYLDDNGELFMPPPPCALQWHPVRSPCVCAREILQDLNWRLLLIDYHMPTFNIFN